MTVGVRPICYMTARWQASEKSSSPSSTPTAPFFQRDGLLTSIKRFPSIEQSLEKGRWWGGWGNDVIPLEMTLKCQSAAADIIHLAHIFLQCSFVFLFSSEIGATPRPPQRLQALLRCAARQWTGIKTRLRLQLRNAPLWETVF